MINISRNLCLYPNVYLMDQFSSQIRHVRPIAVDKTEVTIYCIAPKGESDKSRAHRIRQYEDFFNATGMATQDDLEEFRSCQKTYQATSAPWNDMSRGMAHEIKGPDEQATALGVTNVLASGVRTEDEGLYPVQHGYWKQVMDKAVSELDAEEAAAGIYTKFGIYSRSELAALYRSRNDGPCWAGSREPGRPRCRHPPTTARRMRPAHPAPREGRGRAASAGPVVGELVLVDHGADPGDVPHVDLPVHDPQGLGQQVVRHVQEVGQLPRALGRVG